MKNIIRIFSLLLALLMVATCFVACKKDKDETGGATTQGGPVATVEGPYVSKLPEEMDWNGEEYLVLGQSVTGNEAWYTFEIARETLPNDVVGKAVYNRNDAIKQKYNLVVKEDLQASSNQYIQSFYTTNEDKYDLVMYQLEGIFPHMQSGYLKDISELEYIDFDHPTWNDLTNEQLTLGSSIYAVNSKFNLQNKAQISCLFYNREMARDAGDGYLEDIVTSGEWTLDKYTELVKDYAEDTSGNGIKGDATDTFGTCGDVWNFLTYAQGAGYRASRVVDGKIELAGAGDAILGILNEVGEFYFDSQSCFRTEAATKPLTDYMASINMFREGRALFSCLQITDYDRFLGDISFEVGVLPSPKLNTSQKEHYSTVNFRYSSLCCVPYTVIDTEFAGFGLEVLAEYSANPESTYDSYIETKCKVQNSLDQRMFDMYDIIFTNPIYDIAIIGNFGSLTDIMTKRVPDAGNGNSYATEYRNNKEAAENKINEIMEDLGITA